MSISTTLGQNVIEGVIGNSPGPRKEFKEWKEVGKSPAGMITVGSFTPTQRFGSSGEVFWVDGIPNTALNSLSLPSRHPEEYLDDLEYLKKTYGKPIAVSLAGFSLEDYTFLARMFTGKGLLVELNLTCPNVVGQAIFSFDIEETRRTIFEVRQVIGSETLIVKLNPHPDTDYIDRMCRVLDDEKVDVVALGNTVPNCLVLDAKSLRPVLSPNNGLGGLSGMAVKPIIMGQVFQYRQRLPLIGIIAEGGIWNGQDIIDYFVAGANFCRTATLYALKGAKVFADLTADFINVMQQHGFEKISDIPVMKIS